MPYSVKALSRHYGVHRFYIRVWGDISIVKYPSDDDPLPPEILYPAMRRIKREWDKENPATPDPDDPPEPTYRITAMDVEPGQVIHNIWGHEQEGVRVRTVEYAMHENFVLVNNEYRIPGDERLTVE